MTTPFSMYQVGAEALLPPRDISVSQWADENVVLTGSGSAEQGQWHTRPYQREPMDVLSPSHPCKQVVLMSAAQMLKTSVMVNFLGYIADVDPGPTLAVEPRAEDAKALSKDRVAPLFRHSPALRGKLAAVKSRDSNNTAMHKVFANGSGHITFTGAISPSGLAMRPIRYLLLDEVDRYPLSAGSEGDPVSLAMQRTGEFEHNKKVIMCSTPTVDGESRIQAAWNTSNQREYFVPCPLCNHFQILVFSDGTDGGLVWPEGEPEKAAYCCEKCRELIPHNQKSGMVERGEYRPQNPGSPIPGFRVSQLISPKAVLGNDRRGVPGRQALDGDAQGLPEHRAGGTLDRTWVGTGLGKGLSAARGLRPRDRADEGIASCGWRRRAGRAGCSPACKSLEKAIQEYLNYNKMKRRSHLYGLRTPI